MKQAPMELLQKWIDLVPVGRALDIGAGDGEMTCWLAQRSFCVDAVEKDERPFMELCRIVKGLDVNPFYVDILDFDFSHRAYMLVVASAVMHFLRPTQLWSFVDRLTSSLATGGFFFAQVLTTDDPGYGALREAGVKEIEPNTFILPDSSDVLHYFSPGELPRVFSQLKILEYEESRLIDPEDAIGYRSGASIVARRDD
jgi:trans-aconitate methyltransferase